MYDFGAVSGYTGGYDGGWDEGSAFGSMPTKEHLVGGLVNTAVIGGVAGIFGILEGYQNKGEGGEILLAKKVPVTLVVAGALHAAGFFGVGDALGVGDEYFHSAASGALAVWATNRGQKFGMDRGKAMAKAAVKGTGGGVPRRAFGVPAYDNQQSQSVYPQYETR